MRQIFVLLCTFFYLANVSFAQVNTPFKLGNEQFSKMSEILPPAPNAAAIARYGGVDVDLISGCINKSISLKDFTNKGITVPISLRYTSNGLKVNEYPSRVGMGWAINAGGQISRVIHGRDDLTSTRYLPNFLMGPNEDDINATNYAYTLINVPNTKDAEPDVFSFSFGNYSGKFVLDEDGLITTIQASNLKFAYSTLANNPWKFKIINYTIGSCYFELPTILPLNWINVYVSRLRRRYSGGPCYGNRDL